MLDEDYGDITDPNEGTDLVLAYGKAPGMMYPQTKVQPRRKSSPLCEDGDEACQEIVTTVPDLDTLFERKSTKIMDLMLSKIHLNYHYLNHMNLMQIVIIIKM